MELSGRVAIVTGGTGGLGQAVVRELDRNGAVVYAVSRHGGDQMFRDCPRVHTCSADVTEETAVRDLFQEVGERSGGADILVNLAGGYVGGKFVVETEFSDWQRMWKMNFETALLCTRHFLKTRSRSGSGRIINVVARQAEIPTPGAGAYAVSKAALLMLTKTLAAETAGTDLTVNAISPGIIRTAANEKSMPEADTTRWISPEHIAKTVLFLCSEHGQSISGACIPMYGGLK